MNIEIDTRFYSKDKESLRKHYKELLFDTNFTHCFTHFDNLIFDNLLQLIKSIFLRNKKKIILGCYSKIRNEPNLNDLFFTIPHNIVSNLTLPRIIDNNTMEFLIYDQNTNLIKNRYNILEPYISTKVIPDIIIVPGIAFDMIGNRIGMGKGYYDKYIATYSNVITIGICYDCQIQRLFEYQSNQFDQSMNYLVSNSKIFNYSNLNTLC